MKNGIIHWYNFLFHRWILGCVVLTIPGWMVWCLVAGLGEYKMRDAAVAIGLLYNASVMLLCGPLRKLYLLNKYQAIMDEEERKSQLVLSNGGSGGNSCCFAILLMVLDWQNINPYPANIFWPEKSVLFMPAPQTSFDHGSEHYEPLTQPPRAGGNMFGNRCESACRSMGCEFDPRPVPYFHGDWSWNNFYSHSPPFSWIIQEGLLSVTSESMCTKYWLIACSSLPRKSVVRWTDRPAMTLAVDLGCKATKQTNKLWTWPYMQLLETTQIWINPYPANRFLSALYVWCINSYVLKTFFDHGSKHMKPCIMYSSTKSLKSELTLIPPLVPIYFLSWNVFGFLRLLHEISCTSDFFWSWYQTLWTLIRLLPQRAVWLRSIVFAL